MGKRRILKTATALTALLGMIFIAYPFLSSLKPSDKAESNAYITFRAPMLETGVVKKVSINGKYLFLLRPNQEQKESLLLLDEHVWDKTDRYNSELDIYVYWGYSTKWGCTLEHKEPQESLIKQWKSNAKWHGGFWDNRCEVSYDYAGRAIKTWEHTFNGYTFQHENLKVPSVFEKNGDSYLVSIYER